jgi:dinuclear metal center YbgI/SA1388 family protein
MLIKDIINFLETIAPPSLQEDYDNAGLITGSAAWDCSGALISLDCTEEIVAEAIEKNCNLIIAHHPIVFRGLKKINGKNYVERTVIQAIKNDIAIYAIHTNLDNVLAGVNGKIAEKIGLQNIQILQQKDSQLKKLITFAPPEMADKVKEAIFKAGGGHIGKYSECSFVSTGTSTFKPNEGADPTIGAIGKRETLEEIKMEFIFQAFKEAAIIAAMKDAHDYEEVAYDIIPLGNYLSDTGAGIIGDLADSPDESTFLAKLAAAFGTKVIKHTPFIGKKVKKVAVCGGAGSFLINSAKAAGADAYVTSDIKYHEFFDADGKLLLADIGHYESEQFTIELLFDLLTDKFPNFALLKTGVNTNPVQYFIP